MAVSSAFRSLGTFSGSSGATVDVGAVLGLSFTSLPLLPHPAKSSVSARAEAMMAITKRFI